MQNSTNTPESTSSRHASRTAHQPTTSNDDGPQQVPHTVEQLQQALSNLNHDTLEPTTPAQAIELYLDDRQQEVRDTTLRSHRSALSFFEDWCEMEGVGNLNDLTGRDLHLFRIWRRNDATQKVDTLAKASERNQQKIIRQFLKYGEQIDAVPVGHHNKVRIPTLSNDEVSRTSVLETERVKTILAWLRRHRHARVEHVAWELLARTGARISALVALDVQDYHPEANTPHLEFRTRPETPLKNGSNGERLVALDTQTCSVLNDYLDYNRPDVTDPGERRPLLATDRGRLGKSTIRTYVYRFSRPCAIGNECPHDTDPDACDATTRHKEAQCPSSRSPHAIRRAYITHELSSGIERSLVGDRCDVSESVIAAHYDVRDEHERMQVRQQAQREARQTTERFGGD